MLKNDFVFANTMRTSNYGKRVNGADLRRLRCAANLTQLELSEITGIPRCKLSRYENNALNPSKGTVLAIIKTAKERGVVDDFINDFE